jgi:hypothetical protein
MLHRIKLRLRAIPSPEQLFNASGFRLAFDWFLVFDASSCGVFDHRFDTRPNQH